MGDLDDKLGASGGYPVPSYFRPPYNGLNGFGTASQDMFLDFVTSGGDPFGLDGNFLLQHAPYSNKQVDPALAHGLNQKYGQPGWTQPVSTGAQFGEYLNYLSAKYGEQTAQNFLYTVQNDPATADAWMQVNEQKSLKQLLPFPEMVLSNFASETPSSITPQSLGGDQAKFSDIVPPGNSAGGGGGAQPNPSYTGHLSDVYSIPAQGYTGLGLPVSGPGAIYQKNYQTYLNSPLSKKISFSEWVEIMDSQMVPPAPFDYSTLNANEKQWVDAATSKLGISPEEALDLYEYGAEFTPNGQPNGWYADQLTGASEASIQNKMQKYKSILNELSGTGSAYGTQNHYRNYLSSEAADKLSFDEYMQSVKSNQSLGSADLQYASEAPVTPPEFIDNLKGQSTKPRNFSQLASQMGGTDSWSDYAKWVLKQEQAGSNAGLGPMGMGPVAKFEDYLNQSNGGAAPNLDWPSHSSPNLPPDMNVPKGPKSGFSEAPPVSMGDVNFDNILSSSKDNLVTPQLKQWQSDFGTGQFDVGGKAGMQGIDPYLLNNMGDPSQPMLKYRNFDAQSFNSRYFDVADDIYNGGRSRGRGKWGLAALGGAGIIAALGALWPDTVLAPGVNQDNPNGPVPVPVPTPAPTPTPTPTTTGVRPEVPGGVIPLPPKADGQVLPRATGTPVPLPTPYPTPTATPIPDDSSAMSKAVATRNAEPPPSDSNTFLPTVVAAGQEDSGFMPGTATPIPTPQGVPTFPPKQSYNPYDPYGYGTFGGGYTYY